MIGSYLKLKVYPGRNARADLARAVVHSGWNLLELKSMTYSLEEVFLELTGSNSEPQSPAVAGGIQ